MLFLLATLATILPAQSQVVIYTAQQLHSIEEKLAGKGGQFGAEDLARYPNHYFMLAERGQTGSAELHERESDVFVVQSGTATLVTGGKIVNAKTQKAGEIRGTSIEGGERRRVTAGDIINIQNGTPHQLLLDEGKPFTYFVIKVKGE